MVRDQSMELTHHHTSSSRIGKLQAAPARKAGKLVDEWEYKAPAVGATTATTVAVRVNLVNTDDGLAFEAHAQGFDTFKDSDIERLRSKVFGHLERACASAKGLVWEDWFAVRVQPGTHDGVLSCGLTIQVTPLKVAIDPVSGDAYQLSGNGLWAHAMKSFKITSLQAMLDEEDRRRANGELILDTPEELAFVKATEANIAALQDTARRMRQLRALLAQALSQGSIEQTLNDLAGRLPLLPTPETGAAQDNGADAPAAPRPRGP